MFSRVRARQFSYVGDEKLGSSSNAMSLVAPNTNFIATRLGVIMSPLAGEPHEAWGVLNPGGVRAADGTVHLFPRLIAEGNYSRIGHVRVRFDGETPVGVERLGVALEPYASYEFNAGGGGVEDARVVYVARLKRYVMTYTAFVPYEPRVAIAVSEDLHTWQRLGLVQYEATVDQGDLNRCGNKRCRIFPGRDFGSTRCTIVWHLASPNDPPAFSPAS